MHVFAGMHVCACMDAHEVCLNPKGRSNFPHMPRICTTGYVYSNFHKVYSYSAYVCIHACMCLHYAFRVCLNQKLQMLPYNI